MNFGNRDMSLHDDNLQISLKIKLIPFWKGCVQAFCLVGLICLRNILVFERPNFKQVIYVDQLLLRQIRSNFFFLTYNEENIAQSLKSPV